MLKIRHPWLINLAAFGSAAFLRAWMSTVKLEARFHNGKVHPTDPRYERYIYAFWHESLLAPSMMHTDVKALISQSADGELIARILQRLGIGSVRGSSTRGGAGGLLDMIRACQHSHLAITPDGPRGPRRRLQAGAVFLASRTGLPIVPVGVGFTNAFRFGSWDKFAVPKPFSAMRSVTGAPIAVPPDLDDEGIHEYRSLIETALLQTTVEAEHWATMSASRGRKKNSASETVSEPHSTLAGPVRGEQSTRTTLDTEASLKS